MGFARTVWPGEMQGNVHWALDCGATAIILIY